MSIHPVEVWKRLEPVSQEEIVTEISHVLMEVLDEHFRISSVPSPESSCDDLRAAVESESSRYEQGEPTHAVRAA